MANAEKKLKGLFWRGEFYGAVTDGGVASLYNGLINGFLKTGTDCAFVSSGRMDLPEAVPSYFLPYSDLFRNLPEVLCLPYNNKAVKEVLKIIEIEKPDFIYQHHHDFLYLGSKLKKKTGLPFILHVDGIQYWTKKNWGKLYFDKLLKWIEEIQFDNSDAIFVISDVIKQQLVDYGIDSQKIYVSPNGVDPDIFHPEIDCSEVMDNYRMKDKYIVGFSGSFGQYHGVDFLAKSIKYMKAEIPELMVFFVGDGEYRPIMEEIINKDGVADYVRITGMLPLSEVPKHIAACDILLSPCVSNEDGSEFFNSPIKLFEYLAMGKPIIATDVGQQSDVIQHNVNGLLCPERDPKALADAVIEIYKNKDLAERLGQEARKTAVEKYNWKFNAQRIVDAYHNIISKQKRII